MLRRRQFLRVAAGAGAGLWLSDAGRFGARRAFGADEPPLAPDDIVRFAPEMERTVRLVESVPRERCIEALAAEVRKGLGYRRFLGSLFLAGIRNVSPQPPGFKFHCVFVIQAAHQLSLDAPIEDRFLPLFWALDEFKASQEKDVKEGDFVLRPVRGTLPAPETAWDEFDAAMEAWDAERADRAIVALVRGRGSHEIVGRLWRYGCRDFRNIGHKAIFVANAWRTLQTIGWGHAEPALRSLVLGLLDFGRDRNLNGFAYADQSFVPNEARVAALAGRLPGDWTARAADAAQTRDLLELLRTGTVEECCRTVAERAAGGKLAAASAWDAAHVFAGELMLRQTGIYGIHTVTSIHALRSAYERAADLPTRFLLTLQGIGWMTQFRQFMATARGGLQDVRLTDVAARPLPVGDDAAVAELLAKIGADPRAAAESAAAFAARDGNLSLLIRESIRRIVRKATDPHDYKYPAAVFEDLGRVSPAWRPHLLAAATLNLKGTTQPDSSLLPRIRAALGS